MRNSFDVEPRLMALTEAEIEAQAAPRTWMPDTARAVLDPAHWSPRARRASYWQMGEVVRRPR
jgi:hypothetical protein